MRQLVTSYLDEFLARGDAIAFAHRRGARTIRWSYKQIAKSAFAFAELLAERGVKKNDRLLLCGPNSPEWVVSFFGCLLRGAVVVPLDVQNEPGFVERVQRQVNAKLAVFDTSASQAFSVQLPVIHLEELRHKLSTTCYSAAARSESMNDIAEIVFTSGTTAEPKGVVLTHQNLLANLEPLETRIRPYLKWERFVHPIRFLNLLPLSHVFGQFMGIFVPQLLGGEVFFFDSLKPSQIIETVERERISVIVCVPRMLDTLRERIEHEYHRASNVSTAQAREEKQSFQDVLRAAKDWNVPRRWWKFRRVHRMFGWKFWAFICGGARLNSATEKFWQRLGFAVIQGYGLTETASLISVNHPFSKQTGSIGRVMHGQEVRLANDGEILVRGANVSSGYWTPGTTDDSPAISAAKEPLQCGSRQDLNEAEWFHTGDVGEVDAKGNLYFKGRKKDVIVTAAGMNVYPEDIEAVLNQQPEIKSAVVVGLDGPHGPEPVAALIIQAEAPKVDFPDGSHKANAGTAGAATDEAAVAQVIERANQSLAEHQRVRRWFVWPEEDFPRTTTEKIKRQLVAERIKRASYHHSKLTSANALADLISRVSGQPAATLDPNARLGIDFKLDSLGRLELLSALEDRYRVEINETVFTDATTVGEIQDLIHKRGLEQTSPPVADSSLTGDQKSRFSEYPYPHWPHRWPVNWLRIAGLYLIIFPFVRAMGRARVHGLENLTNRKPPLLFVSNHVSMVDHALILWALPGRFRRRMSIAMDGELLRDWRHGTKNTSWLARLRDLGQYLLVTFFFNVFAMPQHGGFRRSFAFAGEMMDLGYSVLVFPEGRRSPDGNLHTFRPGTGLLAMQLDAPIVPVRLDGVYQLAQKGNHVAPAGAITINVGAPVQCSVQSSAEEISAELEDRVRRAANPPI